MIHAKLRDRIIQLVLLPGQPIDELALVEEFGVSRTPVREALIRLVSEGLVVNIPNRGAYVSQINLGEVREFFECFDLCQRAVTRWAALRHRPDQLDALRRHADRFARALRAGDVSAQCEANMDFHGAIAACCGNACMQGIYGLLLAQSGRLAYLAIGHVIRVKPNLEDRRWLIEEHDLMIKHISERDADAAEAVAHSHARGFLSVIVELLEQTDSPAISVASFDEPPAIAEPGFM